MIEARFHESIDDIPASAWDALRPDDNPFLSHAFLAGLERSGCIRQEWGWQANHLGLYRNGALIAAAPLYLKGNSHGEFVFDWSWASAYARYGLDYYPKLLCAVPYSPVPGPRLLAGDGVDTAALLEAMRAECARLRLSSAHVNFATAANCAALSERTDWLPRFDWQFHWH